MSKYYSRSNNPEEHSISYYLKDISEIPLLSSEQEVELGKEIKKGNKEAVKKLVRHNLKFVVSVAKNYQGMGVSLEDLISEGNIGLIKAAEKFDYERNIHFITHGVWWIRQSILRAISETSRTIRIPMNKLNEISHLNKAISYLKLENPSLKFNELIEEAAKKIDISGKKARELLIDSQDVYSIDEPIKNVEDYTLGDTIVSDYPFPEKQMINEQVRTEIFSYMKEVLRPREEAIIKYRFGLEGNSKTLQETADIFHLSRERIRQIEEVALKKLKPKKTFYELFLNNHVESYKKF